MKIKIILSLLLFCILNNANGEEIKIAYNEDTDQPYFITYRTLEDKPGTVEISDILFSNGLVGEDAYYTVDVVDIPETIEIETQKYTVTTINTENGWGTDYSGPKRIIFPSTIQWIKSGIHSEKLEEVIFNDSPIQEMSYEGFEYCFNLKSISFGNAFKAKSIGRFSDCRNLTEIRIPDSIQEIPWGCFSSCSSLKKVAVPYSITKIEGVAFLDCTSLENIEFYGDKVCECIFVDNEAFKNCMSLREISLPSLSTIGHAAFANCNNLASVTMNTKKDGEIMIGEHAFENCQNLIDLQYESTSLKLIGEAAFNNCSSLKTITIPSNCENIGSRAFSGCSSLEKFYVIGDEGAYSDIDGVLVNYGQQLLAYPAGSKKDSYTMPETITTIANGAFEGAIHLSNISLNENITDIGVMAFRDCKSLKQVKMPEGLNHIPSGTFMGCTALEDVIIPDNYIYIGKSSFQDCSSIKDVKLPVELKVLGESAFITAQI
ncbi:MAG: leucine-rich repeat domain-containing protein [Muribaculaceae bacterium]|nr:leucine-rich repeat domain-containing protein [Muribaculaceae bacterium]